jgi:hypothetical protein
VTAQLWKLGDRGDARLTFECPWCEVVGSSPVLAVHEARDAYWLFAACPVPTCDRGVMVRVSHAIAATDWRTLDTGQLGLLLDRTCVIPTGPERPRDGGAR